MLVNPDSRICHNLNTASGLLSGFDSVFVANAAPVAALQNLLPGLLCAPPMLVPRHSVNALKSAMTAKTRAIPPFGRRSLGEGVPCTGTIFRLKHQDGERCCVGQSGFRCRIYVHRIQSQTDW